MNKLFLVVLILLTGCAGSKPPTTSQTYGGVLPMYRGVISYYKAVPRSGLSSVAADVRTSTWVSSVRQVLPMIEQNPVGKKKGLLYFASLPARQVPDVNGDRLTLPPLQFFLTVDNQGDSSKVWVSNFEVASRSGHWEALEKYKLSSDSTVSTLWLSDINAMVEELMDALTKRLQVP